MRIGLRLGSLFEFNMTPRWPATVPAHPYLLPWSTVSTRSEHCGPQCDHSIFCGFDLEDWLMRRIRGSRRMKKLCSRSSLSYSYSSDSLITYRKWTMALCDTLLKGARLGTLREFGALPVKHSNA